MSRVFSTGEQSVLRAVHTRVASGTAGKKVVWKSDVPAVFITWHY